MSKLTAEQEERLGFAIDNLPVIVSQIAPSHEARAAKISDEIADFIDTKFRNDKTGAVVCALYKVVCALAAEMIGFPETNNGGTVAKS